MLLFLLSTLPSTLRPTPSLLLDHSYDIVSSVVYSTTVNILSLTSHTSSWLSPPFSSSSVVISPVIPQPQPVVAKLPPTNPYYGHEETAKICARFIKHVFNCPPDRNQPCESISQVGHGSTT